MVDNAGMRLGDLRTSHLLSAARDIDRQFDRGQASVPYGTDVHAANERVIAKLERTPDVPVQQLTGQLDHRITTGRRISTGLKAAGIAGAAALIGAQFGAERLSEATVVAAQLGGLTTAGIALGLDRIVGRVVNEAKTLSSRVRDLATSVARGSATVGPAASEAAPTKPGGRA